MSMSGPLFFVLDAVPSASLSGPLSTALDAVPPQSLSGPLPSFLDIIPPQSLSGPLASVLDLIPESSLSGALGLEVDFLADGVHGRQIMTRSTPNTRVAPNSLTDAELASGAVGRDEIQSGAVSPPKLDRGYVESPFEIAIFSDTLREIVSETPPGSGTINDQDIAIFADAATNGGRFGFTIPDEWNGLSDIEMTLIWRNALAVTGDHVMRTLFRVNGGALSAAQVNALAAPGTTQEESPVVLAITSGDANPGDNIAVRLFRDGADGGDTENQDLEVYRIVIKVPVAT